MYTQGVRYRTDEAYPDYGRLTGGKHTRAGLGLFLKHMLSLLTIVKITLYTSARSVHVLCTSAF